MNVQPTVEKQEQLYQAVVINAPLPSLGKIYDEKSVLFNKEYVSIREMSGVEEDILTSPALLRSGKSIDAVLKNCILDKTINVDEMIIGDRNSVIISLILASYGASYKVDVTCPNCGEKIKNYEFDVTKLPIKNLEVEPDDCGACKGTGRRRRYDTETFNTKSEKE